MARHPDSRTAGPGGLATLAPVRWYGSLDTITDSERRGLRPIGTSAYEAAARTGILLGTLPAGPGVRIFQGLCPAAAEQDLPRIPHAISAGRQLILVESVAWPPGRYRQEPGGQIHCDGMYTGQSVQPLADAVRYWREALPRGHWISALVVVHRSGDPAAAADSALASGDSALAAGDSALAAGDSALASGDGGLALPAGIAGEMAWTRARDLIRVLRARLARSRAAAHPRAIGALLAATAGK